MKISTFFNHNKCLLSVLLCFFLNPNAILYGQLSNQEACDKVNRTLNETDENNLLSAFLIDDDRKGILNLHPFTIDEIGGWDVFLNFLTDDPDISFSFVNLTQSRLSDGAYYKYEQKYKGVSVINGGFSILVGSDKGAQLLVNPPCLSCPPPSNSCDDIHLLSIAPHIVESINIEINGISPLSKQTIATSLQVDINDIESKELKIINNSDNDCSYKLASKVYYKDDEKGEQVSYIDETTGEILSTRSKHNFKNAPTADWGEQFLFDQLDGNQTILRNDRLTVYDMSGITSGPLGVPLTNVGLLSSNYAPNQIPTSPSNRDWLSADVNSAEVFQTFWMTDQILTIFENELDIVFTDVHVGVHPTASNALETESADINNRVEIIIGVDITSALPLVEYDVIGHELGHAIIGEHFRSTFIEGGSLHEGIADMIGVYAEAKLDELDWEMADDAEGFWRDLENPVCFAEIEGVHARGLPLGHWFHLCVNGDATTGILPMNIDDLMNLVIEALPTLSGNPDFPDLMEATVDLARTRYKTCSDEFSTITRAWNQICIPTEFMEGDPCIELLETFALGAVCEEDNGIQVCLSSDSGLNLNAGRWRLIGENDFLYESNRGMSGNTQSGGSCIIINHIPDMPYYPQKLTITYWHPQVDGTQSVSVTIKDCDGDDLTCQEYYDSSLSPRSDKADENFLNLNLKELKCIAYDIAGNKIGDYNVGWRNSNIISPRVLILTYWNDRGKFVSSKKIVQY